MSRYAGLLVESALRAYQYAQAETIRRTLIGTGTGDGHFLLNYLQDRPDDASVDQRAIGRG
jgi:hypothetical protein